MTHIHRRRFLHLGAAAGLALSTSPAFAAAKPRRRIIDVHMHSYPVDAEMPSPLKNPITGKEMPVRNGAEHFTACLAEMKRHNVVKGVVSGGNGDRLAAALRWHDNEPDRF